MKTSLVVLIGSQQSEISLINVLYPLAFRWSCVATRSKRAILHLTIPVTLTNLSFQVLTFQNHYPSICLPRSPRYFHNDWTFHRPLPCCTGSSQDTECLHVPEYIATQERPCNRKGFWD